MRQACFSPAMSSHAYGTFPNQHLDMERHAAEMAIRAPKSQLVRLIPGETFSCDT